MNDGCSWFWLLVRVLWRKNGKLMMDITATEWKSGSFDS